MQIHQRAEIQTKTARAKGENVIEAEKTKKKIQNVQGEAREIIEGVE